MINRLTPSSPEVLEIPIRECGEPLVDIQCLGGIAIGPVPECPETASDYTFVRQTIYEKLLKAQSLLPDGVKLKLYEGYRSLDVQEMLFQQELERVRGRFPNISAADCFSEATRMVSAVHYPDGTLNIPPHNTGAAVDLYLTGRDGSPLDMGMDIYQWTKVDPDLCVTRAANLTTEATKNRQLLFDIMEQVGFKNYPQEWWHFSYGDRFWAYLSGHDNALYGGITHTAQ